MCVEDKKEEKVYMQLLSERKENQKVNLKFLRCTYNVGNSHTLFPHFTLSMVLPFVLMIVDSPLVLSHHKP